MPNIRSDTTGGAGSPTVPVPTSRRINTTSPLQGGGNLGGDLTLSIDAGGFGDVFKATNNLLTGRNIFSGPTVFRGDVQLSGHTHAYDTIQADGLVSFGDYLSNGVAFYPGHAIGFGAYQAALTLLSGSISGTWVFTRNSPNDAVIMQLPLYQEAVAAKNRYVTSGELSGIVSGGGSVTSVVPGANIVAQPSVITTTGSIGLAPNVSIATLVTSSDVLISGTLRGFGPSTAGSPVFDFGGGATRIRYFTNPPIAQVNIAVTSHSGSISGNWQVSNNLPNDEFRFLLPVQIVAGESFRTEGNVQMSGVVAVWTPTAGTGLTIGDNATFARYQAFYGNQGAGGYQFVLVGSGLISGPVSFQPIIGTDLVDIQMPVRVSTGQSVTVRNDLSVSGASIFYGTLNVGDPVNHSGSTLYGVPRADGNQAYFYVPSGSVAGTWQFDRRANTDNVIFTLPIVAIDSTVLRGGVQVSGTSIFYRPAYQGSVASQNRYVTSGELSVAGTGDTLRGQDNFFVGSQDVFGPSTTVTVSGTFNVGDTTNRTGSTFYGAPRTDGNQVYIYVPSGSVAGTWQFDRFSNGDKFITSLPIIALDTTTLRGGVQISGSSIFYRPAYQGSVASANRYVTSGELSAGAGDALRAQDNFWTGAQNVFGPATAVTISGSTRLAGSTRITGDLQISGATNLAYAPLHQGSATGPNRYVTSGDLTGDTVRGASNFFTGTKNVFGPSTAVTFSGAVTFEGSTQLHEFGTTQFSQQVIEVNAGGFVDTYGVSLLGGAYMLFNAGCKLYMNDTATFRGGVQLSGGTLAYAPIHQGVASGGTRYITSGELTPSSGDAVRAADNFWSGGKNVWAPSTLTYASGVLTIGGELANYAAALAGTPGIGQSFYGSQSAADGNRYILIGSGVLKGTTRFKTAVAGDMVIVEPPLVALGDTTLGFNGTGLIVSAAGGVQVSGTSVHYAPIYQGAVSGSRRYVTSGELQAGAGTGDAQRASEYFWTGSQNIFSSTTRLHASGLVTFGSSGGTRITAVGDVQASGITLHYSSVGVGTSNFAALSTGFSAEAQAGPALTDTTEQNLTRTMVRAIPAGDGSSAKYRANDTTIYVGSGVYTNVGTVTGQRLNVVHAGQGSTAARGLDVFVGTADTEGTALTSSGVFSTAVGVNVTVETLNSAPATATHNILRAFAVNTVNGGSAVVSTQQGGFFQLTFISPAYAQVAENLRLAGFPSPGAVVASGVRLVVAGWSGAANRYTYPPEQIRLDAGVASATFIGVRQLGSAHNRLQGGVTLGADSAPGDSVLLASGQAAFHSPIYQGWDRTGVTRYVTSGEITGDANKATDNFWSGGKNVWAPSTLIYASGVLAIGSESASYSGAIAGSPGVGQIFYGTNPNSAGQRWLMLGSGIVKGTARFQALDPNDFMVIQLPVFALSDTTLGFNGTGLVVNAAGSVQVSGAMLTYRPMHQGIAGTASRYVTSGELRTPSTIDIDSSRQSIGTSAWAIGYSYTIPANTLSAGRGFRFKGLGGARFSGVSSLGIVTSIGNKMVASGGVALTAGDRAWDMDVAFVARADGGQSCVSHLHVGEDFTISGISLDAETSVIGGNVLLGLDLTQAQEFRVVFGTGGSAQASFDGGWLEVI